MTHSETIDRIIEKERLNPTFSKHHINSYLTNLPVENENTELRSILKYFRSPDVFLPLTQSQEFRNGLSIEVRAEMIDADDRSLGITRRESLYHNHDFFEMMYVYAGTCTNFISGKEMKLQAGDLLLYNLQTVHKLVIDDPDTAVFNILAGQEVFCGLFLDLMKSEDPLMQFYVHSIYNIPGDQFMIFHLAEDEGTVMPLHDLIIESVRKDTMFDKIMQADFLNLLIRLARLRSHRQAEKSAASKDGMDINEVLTYIHDNYRTVTLQSLSDHYSYTTRSMIRFLKKYTARTFTEIVREYRLLNACGWLKNTDKSIDEIALETGFTERGYFDKVFKIRFRMTPYEFRLNMAGNDII